MANSRNTTRKARFFREYRFLKNEISYLYVNGTHDQFHKRVPKDCYDREEICYGSSTLVDGHF